MNKKLAAVIASAACAGLIVTIGSSFAPEVAAGASPSVDRSAPSGVTANTPAAEVVPTAAEIRTAGNVRGSVEQNVSDRSRNLKIVCEHSWPYYESSCIRDGRQAGGVRAVRLIAADRPAAVPLQSRR
jgi:hypothetical protein